MDTEILITGGTGFLGRRLIAELVAGTDAQLWVLARSNKAGRRLLAEVPAERHDRIRFLRGDVCSPMLGLDGAVVSSLSRRVTEVWHLAALTSFDESKRDEVFRANVSGTRNLLELAHCFPRLECLYHMSTAYVCGNRRGCIPEGPFDVPEGFKNPYEESKWVAEDLVYSSGLPFIVFRPSITPGDSRTGDSGGENRMMYGYLHGVLRAAMHAFDSAAAYWNYYHDAHAESYMNYLNNVKARLVGHNETRKNAITVDDVASICIAARKSPSIAVGKTFHIVNAASLTCHQIIGVMQRAAKVTGYVYHPLLTFDQVRRGNVVERAAYRYTRLFHAYTLDSEPCWAIANVDLLDTPRVLMTEDLFELLMERHVQYLAPPK